MINRHQKIAGTLTMKALTALRNMTELDPPDVIRFLKLATELEKQALGEPNQTIAVTGPSGGPIVTEDITALSTEERRVRLKDIASELARRAGMQTIETDEE
jgi:predicted RNA-binding protein